MPAATPGRPEAAAPATPWPCRQPRALRRVRAVPIADRRFAGSWPPPCLAWQAAAHLDILKAPLAEQADLRGGRHVCKRLVPAAGAARAAGVVRQGEQRRRGGGQSAGCWPCRAAAATGAPCRCPQLGAAAARRAGRWGMLGAPCPASEASPSPQRRPVDVHAVQVPGSAQGRAIAATRPGHAGSPHAGSPPPTALTLYNRGLRKRPGQAGWAVLACMGTLGWHTRWRIRPCAPSAPLPHQYIDQERVPHSQGAPSSDFGAPPPPGLAGRLAGRALPSRPVPRPKHI